MILAVASPFTLGLALATSTAYTACVTRPAQNHPALRQRLLWLAWGLHALLLGWGLLVQAPHFGFAPALSVTVWLIGLVYVLEVQFYPQLRLPRVLAALSAASVLMALLFPGAPLPDTASPWLPLHWALGLASYGLFGSALVHAALMSRAEASMRSARSDRVELPLLTLERLTFRFVGLGFALLSLTLLAGLFFGSALYGPQHALRLDHKTTFSILAWATFAGLLLARARLGWRGRRAVRVLYIGCGLLLLAYVGSRFVLEVILRRGL
ncbi:MAG: cytochrome c biogenesis protein CcsA [Rhodoferax sp.]